MRFLGLIVLVCAAAVNAAPFFPAPQAEQRIALVIGNSAYKDGPLSNPVNDAKAMAKTLTKTGFKVIERINVGQQEMVSAISAFGDELQKSGGVGLFYFAGHGLQIKGRNYLVPVNAQIKREDDVIYMAVDASMVTDKMETAKNRMNIVILDACRNNPFAKTSRASGGGLVQMDAPVGTLVAFSTAPGSVASDGEGINGLYTQHLLVNIEQSGLRIEEVFKKVRLGVRLDSDGMQIPWENTSLEGDFSFIGGEKLVVSNVPSVLIGTGKPPPAGIAAIASTEKAYRLLQEGKVDQSEQVFKSLVSHKNPEVVMMGREGLAEIMFVRGQISEAISASQSIIQEYPNRTAAYLIKGRAQATLGNLKDAEVSVRGGGKSGKQTDFSWQQANLYVASANIIRKINPDQAKELYEKAQKENPDSVVAISNHADLLTATGNPKKAAQLLEKAKALDPEDQLTQALLARANDAIKQQHDAQRQKYIDDSVKELVTRFKEQKAVVQQRPADDWTSPVMAISLLGIEDRTAASLVGRVGVDSVLTQELSRQLLASNLAVVDRAVLDKVMAELKLGSSELADPDTQLKLGRLFAARLILTGDMYPTPQGSAVNLRGIDVETTRIALSQVENGSQTLDPFRAASALARSVTQMIKAKYPIKGRIADASDDTIIINLGKKHGVMPGQQFNVLGESKPIELNGKILGYKESKLGSLEIVEAQDLMAFAKAVDVKGKLEKNQRIILKN